jgi:hemolysin
VQLSSGGNQVQQGTKIDSADGIDLHADGKLDLQAAVDTTPRPAAISAAV